MTGYYAETVAPPKRPGEMALSVFCATEAVRDLEVRVFNEREDIGRVSVVQRDAR